MRNLMVPKFVSSMPYLFTNPIPDHIHVDYLPVGCHVSRCRIDELPDF